MAYFCINSEKEKNCKYLFIGAVLRTDKKLCNILDKSHKPCFTECVCIGECKCEIKENGK